MNLPINPEISLYQLTQKSQNPPQSIFVTAITFKSLVSNLLDILSEQKLATTICTKLPANKNWRQEIERYQNSAIASSIYSCSTKEYVQHLSGTIPIQLTPTSILKKEHFVIAISSQFCALILAQQQKKTNQKYFNGAIAKRTDRGLIGENRIEQQNLKTIFTDNPEAIASVLAGIKQSLTDRNNPEAIATLKSLKIPQTSHSPLTTNLLLKQIQNDRSNSYRSDNISLEEITDNSNLFTNLEDKFIKDLVRELQSPLTNMKTALRLLESNQLKRNQRQKYLELIDRECNRQNSTIDGLLKLAQLDNVPEKIPAPSEKLEEIIPGIVSTYQPLAKERGIQLGYTIPPSFPPVTCPSNWLRQIILHLLNNSLKFTPTAANGRVFVTGTVKKDSVQITITDNGVGIDRLDLPQIFDPFFRGKNIGDRGNSGPGLGLTIVRQILDRCDGKISVSSSPGTGSTFTVSLPITIGYDSRIRATSA